MSLLNNIIRGATSQFGREFGRAAANSILKGRNHYTINNTSDYNGRIKPSDSNIVKSIKEIKKIKFTSSDKSNSIKMIEITDIVLRFIEFDGDNTLISFNDLTTLRDEFNKKVELYESIGGNYENVLLKKRMDEFNGAMDIFNDKIGSFVLEKQEYHKEKEEYYKSIAITKKKAILFSVFTGIFGGHNYYLKEYGWAITLTLLGLLILNQKLWIIPVAAWVISSLVVLSTPIDKFNQKYNPELCHHENEISFYNNFTVTPN